MRKLLALFTLGPLLLMGCSVPAPLLEPAPAPQSVETSPREPKLRIWAIDPEGAQTAPELLFGWDRPGTNLVATSADGRYLLLATHLGQGKGDYAAIPHLLDRESGHLTTGAEIQLRNPVWSGEGFWLDHLRHLNLDGTLTTYPALIEALGESAEREIRSSAIGGTKVVALIGKPRTPDLFDLAWGALDGSAVQHLSGLIQPHETQMGNIAAVALSPDGRYIAVTGWQPYGLIIDTTNPERERWVEFEVPPDRLILNLAWAPDSAHVLIDGYGVIDLDGELLRLVEGFATWSPKGGLLRRLGDTTTWQIIWLEGGEQSFAAPDGWPVGFLPDGRVITSAFDPGV